jgi:iron complex outermembrane receptor protein
MKLKKSKKVNAVIYGIMLALPMSFWAPPMLARAEENAPQVAPQDDTPVIQVEVKDTKDKKKAEGVNNYIITQSSTGSKSDVATKDIPQSIAVVGQKVMAEQNVQTIDQALSNVAGVMVSNLNGTAGASYNNQGATYNIRGFGATLYVDGMPADSNFSGWAGNVDHIEVLKGSSSALYGSGDAGGVINIVTKQPSKKYSFKLSQEFGSWGTKSTKIDTSIPLTEDGKWLSETIIDYSGYDTFQKDVEYKKFNGSVKIQGKPQKDTTYTLEATFNHYDNPSSNANVIAAPQLSSSKYPGAWALPNDGSYYNPNYRNYYNGQSFSGRVDHTINDIWTVHTKVGYTKFSSDNSELGGNGIANIDGTWFGYPGYTGSAGGYPVDKKYILMQAYDGTLSHSDTLSWETAGNAKFKTGVVEHNMALGYDWERSTTNMSRWSSPIAFVDASQGYLRTIPGPITRYDPTSTSKYKGTAFLSDTLKLSKKWNLTLSDGLSTLKTSNSSASNSVTSNGNSSRVGVTYEIKPGLNWFAGYATSVTPDESQDGNNNYLNFAPQKANQQEMGIKYDVSNRANITVSTYKIKKDNMVVSTYQYMDPVTFLPVFTYNANGTQTSQGFDIDANYIIKPGWNVMLSYAQDKTINDETGKGKGYVMGATPERQYKLWTTYEVQSGDMKGWGFGGGLTYIGNRMIQQANNVYIPAYKTVDAVVYYKHQDWRYSLNLNNLTNSQYYTMANMNDVAYVHASLPRNFVLRIEKTFN